jgi:hypothetical protein
MYRREQRMDAAVQLLRLSGLTLADQQACHGMTNLICEGGTSISVCDRGGLSISGAEARRIWRIVLCAIEDEPFTPGRARSPR